MNEFIKSDSFNLDTDFILISKKKDKSEEIYSTPYTIVSLEYDTSDVLLRLKELDLSEYSETKLDRDDLNPPKLYVFGKIINNRLIYIKLKLKGWDKKKILCVSFHFAKDEMIFPYKKEVLNGK